MTSQIDKDLIFEPDYASLPGDFVLECISDLGISARELARRCGRSGKLISEIITGKAPIEPETAIQFERVLGISALVWLGMDAAYQLQAARAAEKNQLAIDKGWVRAFPTKELVARGCLRAASDISTQARELLTFFGAGSVQACEDRIDELLQVAFRTSETFESDRAALAAWLRIGELQALKAEAAEFNKDNFTKALESIRALTLVSIDEALPKVTRLCAKAGIVFVLEKPLNKVRASGVSRWISPKRALIQQSLRHKSDDHFWFTFFHECAHILLHGKKEVFIDMSSGPGSSDPRQEAEANIWAAQYLIPHAAMKRFELTFTGSDKEVCDFAAECGVSPGIVVGQLQHRQVIGFAALNHLKARYKWSE